MNVVPELVGGGVSGGGGKTFTDNIIPDFKHARTAEPDHNNKRAIADRFIYFILFYF